MKKKKKNNAKYVILIIIIVIGLLAVTSFNIKNNRNLTFVERAIKDSTLFVSKIIYAPIQFITDKFSFNCSDNDSKTIDRYKAELMELQKENEELQSLLKLNSSLSDYEYINASVINRDIGYWYNSLTIDKGELDGIELGMAVIIDGGIIGRVSYVSNFNSTVSLLTSDDLVNKISVKIDTSDDEVYGLLSGYDASDYTYTIDGIGNNKKIKKGDIVTTTGLNENFPSGILVGEVKEITTDNFDLSRIVKVTPSVNFDNIRYVMVLKRGRD